MSPTMEIQYPTHAASSFIKKQMTKQQFTQSVHAGSNLANHYGALSTPIYSSSTYAFPNAEQGAAIHEGEMEGYFYGRIGNPTQETLESALAQLENGEAAMAFSSGMAAISNALMTILDSGDHIIVPTSLYASTTGLLKFLESKMGVEYTSVDATVSDNYLSALKPNTKAIYIESPANPTLQLTDIKSVVEIAKESNLITMADNTFASPINQNPIDLGVDIVLHSLTKYIGGHGDLLAGAVIGSKEFVERCRWHTNKLLGGVIAPQVAWIAHRGIKTLAIRITAHNSNALKCAQFLESHPKVKRVHYPGLTSHPQYELAKTQMRGFGGMIAFEVDGLNEGQKLIDSLNLCTLAVSLGDVSTLIQHSASMTHASVPKEQREKAGITDGLLRLSVGIEYAEDIITDLEQGLSQLN